MAWKRRATTTPTSEAHGRWAGYRSGLEEKVAAQLQALGIDPAYEEHTLRYTKPARVARYTPDFPLPNGIIIETKGRFVTADRQKHLLVQSDHPDLDVRFVFSNPSSRIGKKSNTSYAMWCEHHGFLYAAKLIPIAWINEPAEERRVAAMKAAFKLH